MAERTASIQNCGVCWEKMNLDDRAPVCLPSCGHSFCRKCLITINRVERQIRCPTCKKLHAGPPPEDLPVNWAVAGLLESAERNGPPRNMKEAPATSDDAGKPMPKDKSPNCNDGFIDADINGPNSQGKKILKGLGIAAATVVGGVGLVAAAPVVLTGVGFASAGVTAGSWAAGMMSAAAAANGGGIAAGSLVAVLQSAGAAGIGTAATATLGGAGAGVGGGIGYGLSRWFSRSSRSNEGTNSSGSDSPGNDDDDDVEKRGQCDADGKNRRSTTEKDEEKSEDDEEEKEDDKDDDELCEIDKKFSCMNLDVTKTNQIV